MGYRGGYIINNLPNGNLIMQCSLDGQRVKMQGIIEGGKVGELVETNTASKMVRIILCLILSNDWSVQVC